MLELFILPFMVFWFCLGQKQSQTLCQKHTEICLVSVQKRMTPYIFHTTSDGLFKWNWHVTIESEQSFPLWIGSSADRWTPILSLGQLESTFNIMWNHCVFIVLCCDHFLLFCLVALKLTPAYDMLIAVTTSDSVYVRFECHCEAEYYNFTDFSLKHSTVEAKASFQTHSLEDIWSWILNVAKFLQFCIAPYIGRGQGYPIWSVFVIFLTTFTRRSEFLVRCFLLISLSLGHLQLSSVFVFFICPIVLFIYIPIILSICPAVLKHLFILLLRNAHSYCLRDILS